MARMTATGFVVSDAGARVGDKAPQFSLPCARCPDPSEAAAALTDYRGRWLVLLFYPFDFDPISQTELLAFDAHAADLRAREVELLAISTDSTHAHRNWLKQARAEGGICDLVFALGSDSTHAVAAAYGVLMEEQGYAQRATFIIDPKGIVRHSVTYDTEVGRSSHEVLRVLSALGTGEAQAADWQPA
jgi:alkyl hydroperoxide reductase subunit AhpC